jgi:hypothetical protein
VIWLFEHFRQRLPRNMAAGSVIQTDVLKKEDENDKHCGDEDGTSLHSRKSTSMLASVAPGTDALPHGCLVLFLSLPGDAAGI